MIPSPSSYHIQIWNHLIYIKKLGLCVSKKNRYEGYIDFIYFFKVLKTYLWNEQLLIQISTYIKMSGILQCHSFSDSLREFSILFWGKFFTHLHIYIVVWTLYHQHKISTFIHNFYHKRDKTTPKCSLDVLISIFSTFC